MVKTPAAMEICGEVVFFNAVLRARIVSDDDRRLPSGANRRRYSNNQTGMVNWRRDIDVVYTNLRKVTDRVSPDYESADAICVTGHATLAGGAVL